jgi:hypothetical protein
MATSIFYSHQSLFIATGIFPKYLQINGLYIFTFPVLSISLNFDLIPHEDVSERGGIAPHLLNLDARWKLSVQLQAPAALLPGKEHPVLTE